MKHLLLLRHAEAEVCASGASDFDRMLTERGHSEAHEAAACLVATSLRIDSVLASPARRARDTVSIVVAQLQLAVAIEYEPHLYLASPDTLLQVLRTNRAHVSTALLVGHNPGLSELAQQLSGCGQNIALRTGGLCHLTFAHSDWTALGIESPSRMVLVR